jgi:hypothetical protein
MEGTGKPEQPVQPEGGAVVDPREMPERILAEIQNMSRLPFQREMAEILSIQPDRDSRQRFYNKYPDKRGQEAAIFARLSGYSEGIKITAHFNVLVANMSDMELVKELEEANRRLDALEAKQGVSRRRALPEATGGDRPKDVEVV